MTEKIPDIPLVFDIARASFDDGPGVRTVVFFKGCPLSCPWCHNPESQNYRKEIMLFPEVCIDCKNCQAGKSCFTGARKEVGQSYTAEKLAQLLIKDKPYYAASNGGVTFSGGEALSYIPYLSKLSRLLKEEKIHIAVQTCGYFDHKAFSSLLLPFIDLIYFDLKIMDNHLHTSLLGKSNQVILNNFTSLLGIGIKLIPRVPLVPGFTTQKENLDAIADFFIAHRINHFEFLYYHPGAEEKRSRLMDKAVKSAKIESLEMSEYKVLINLFKERMRQSQKVQ